MKSGGAVADLNDYPVAAYIAARPRAAARTSRSSASRPTPARSASRVDKENTQLRDALKEAVDAIIKDGEYKKVLEKWDVRHGAVTEADDQRRQVSPRASALKGSHCD